MSCSVLFIAKKCYRYEGSKEVSRGLRLSAEFVVRLLSLLGISAQFREAIDGNSIDALIHALRPDRVVIEAIWVTPAKMAELIRLWPRVRWTVRIHSEFAFLASEGVAISWLAAYLSQGIEVAFNSGQAADDFRAVGRASYLPNYYPLGNQPISRRRPRSTVEVGCFGAVRPLKNQLTQAAGAIMYARSHGRPLVFHMNGSRIEQMGENSLRNVQAVLLAAGATLELHPWLEHVAFLDLVAEMDFCLQVSLSETFCICAADAVAAGVPLVGSPAIRWLPKEAQADPASAESIAAHMENAWADRSLTRHGLTQYLRRSADVWRAWARA